MPPKSPKPRAAAKPRATTPRASAKPVKPKKGEVMIVSAAGVEMLRPQVWQDAAVAARLDRIATSLHKGDCAEARKLAADALRHFKAARNAPVHSFGGSFRRIVQQQNMDAVRRMIAASSCKRGR